MSQASEKKKSQELTRSILIKMAEKYGVDESRLLETLKATAFKQSDGSAPTNEQMMALLVVSDQYGLNPFTKEIYAFPDKHNHGIIPVVGVDGWSRIINQHPHFDGVEFVYSPEMVTMPGADSQAPSWIEAVIYRKDRSRPIHIREFLDECYKPPGNRKGPWQTHPKRFLRHKAFIQCARIALGYVGIYDIDEAENILGNTIDSQTGVVLPSKAPGPMLEHKKMDELLEGLINRSKEEGTWHGAQQLVKERFHDQPELLREAAARLHDAEVNFQFDTLRTDPSGEHEEQLMEEAITTEPSEVESSVVEEVDEESSKAKSRPATRSKAGNEKKAETIEEALKPDPQQETYGAQESLEVPEQQW